MLIIQCTLYVLKAPDILRSSSNGDQIGFLTEWQMYAQRIEGNNWKDEKLDKAKIDKMSGRWLLRLYYKTLLINTSVQTNRLANSMSLCKLSKSKTMVKDKNSCVLLQFNSSGTSSPSRMFAMALCIC